MKKTLLLVTLLTVGSLSFTGCTNSTPTQEETPTTTTLSTPIKTNTLPTWDEDSIKTLTETGDWSTDNTTPGAIFLYNETTHCDLVGLTNLINEDLTGYDPTYVTKYWMKNNLGEENEIVSEDTSNFTTTTNDKLETYLLTYTNTAGDGKTVKSSTRIINNTVTVDGKEGTPLIQLNYSCPTGETFDDGGWNTIVDTLKLNLVREP